MSVFVATFTIPIARNPPFKKEMIESLGYFPPKPVAVVQDTPSFDTRSSTPQSRNTNEFAA
jgi:hypothetical protein